jgi:hypothetical protein
MVGSSRTAWGLHAGTVEKDLSRSLDRPVAVFNFGLPGTGPVTNLITLKRLLADGARPDLLLVEVLPAYLLGLVLVEVEEVRLPTSHLRRAELSLVKRYSIARQGLRRDWWLTWAVPCYGHRVAILSDLLPALLGPFERWREFERIDDFGWEPTSTGCIPPEAHARALRRVRESLTLGFRGSRLNEAAAASVRETLETCRTEHVPVALVLLPEGRALRDCFPPGSWEQVKSFLTNLSQHYAIPLIDARTWMQEKDFVDSEHLRGDSAGPFSERLGREALEPLLRHAP